MTDDRDWDDYAKEQRLIYEEELREEKAKKKYPPLKIVREEG